VRAYASFVAANAAWIAVRSGAPHSCAIGSPHERVLPSPRDVNANTTAPAHARSATHVAMPVLWLSVLNATACTVAPVLMVMMAIERIGAAAAAQIGMVGPLSTILMGVVILGEPFTATMGLGTVLVLAGIWLLTRRR